MTGFKGPVLLVAGGCAAMLGAAVVTVSLGSFLADMPATTTANAAVASVVPVKKVKSVAVTQDKPAPPQPAQVVADAQPVAPTGPERVAAEADDESPLANANPRWAHNAGKTQTASGADTAAIESSFANDRPSESAALKATESEMGQSEQTFAALANGQAASEDGVVFDSEMDALPTPRPEKPKAKADAPQEPAATGGRAVTVNAGVNMRSAPRSGSGVIGVVPRGAKVSLASACESWCRISYNGRTGYVWKSFIGGGGGKVQARKISNRKPAAADVQTSSDQPGLFGNSGTLNNDGSGAKTVANEKPAAAKPAIKPVSTDSVFR